jgi:molybdopterin molybdotransferase
MSGTPVSPVKPGTAGAATTAPPPTGRAAADPAASRRGHAGAARTSPAEARAEARPDAVRDLDWDSAVARAHAAGTALGNAYPSAVESEPLARAAGRTLAAPLRALTAIPAFASSAMDGWAVTGDGPWTVGDPILAGARPTDEPLASGVARPIATGAPVPPGASAILRSEHGDVVSGARGAMLATNAFARAGEPFAGQHIRPAGEQAGPGDILLAEGATLDSRGLALAATAGVDEVPVRAARECDLLVLGDELRSAGAPRPGEVRDALGPSLPTVLERAGLRMRGRTRCADDHDATVAALEASTADLVVTTGGSAHGPADFVRSALDRLGARMLVDGVTVRPGHPVGLARLPDGRLVLCLPGNPLAALLCLAGLGLPLIDGLAGRPVRRAPRVLVAAGIPNPGSATRLVPCRFEADGAVPTRWQGSAMVRGLADSDAVVVVPPGGVAAGSTPATLPVAW